MAQRLDARSLLDPALILPALGDSLRKLDPRGMIRNPVMFTVEVVATLASLALIRDIAVGADHIGFSLQLV
ncbi:MAG: hypothetical protein AB7F08_04660, partial [Dongiaceae bacterium]